MAAEIPVEDDKKESSILLSNLLDAVRECQRQSTVTKEILTENNSCVSCLCRQFEIALSDGLKKSVQPSSGLSNIKYVTGLQNEPELCFWNVMEPLLTKHELHRFNNLSNIKTDIGRGRAWLRCSLNEHSLERMLQMLLGDIIVLQQYYSPNAFLRDDERASLLPQAAAGLKPVVFCIKIDDDALDKISPVVSSQTESSFALSSLSYVTNLLQNDFTMEEFPEANATPEVHEEKKATRSSSKKKRRKKKNIISFDNDRPSRLSSAASSEAGSDIYSDNIYSSHHQSTSRTLSSLSSYSESSVHSVEHKTNPTHIAKPASIETEESTAESLASLNEDTAGDSQHNLTPVASDTESALSFSTPPSTTILNRSLVETNKNPSLDLGVGTLKFLKSPGISNTEEASDLAANHPLVKKNAELQKALVALLQRKEDLLEENNRLHIMLDAEKKHVVSLKLDLEQLQGNITKKDENVKLEIEKNSRENEVLRNQLKKYVGAVQVLQQEQKNREFVDKDEATTTNKTTDKSDSSKSLPGPSNANENLEDIKLIYENKLSNVAQMHGELIEFTENLQTRQISAVSLLRKMHDELVSLRGPMPTDDLIRAIEGGPDQSISFSSSSVTSPIVNVWVPSVFMQGSGPDGYHVYQVYICVGSNEWNVYRRYSDFLKMHTALCKVYPQVEQFVFPPKKGIGNKSHKFVEERRKLFQKYLRLLMNNIFQSNVELRGSPNKNTLIHILPFFSDAGDQCKVLLSKKKK